MIPTLTDYQTGEAIRPATRGEHQRSREAERANGTGAFLLDGRSVFVAGDFPPTRLYRITNPATGADLGTYAGADKARALDNYAYTAGYESFAAACEETGDDPGDDAGLLVVEVTEADEGAPGPWSAHRNDDGSSLAYEIRTAAGGCVGWAGGWSDYSGNDAGTAANARLLAAAPDLLAALRALVAWDDADKAQGFEGDTRYADLDTVIDRARTAIRAAMGAQ